MNKIDIVLISGSPRQGNTEFILNQIYKSFPFNCKLFLLREMKIFHCLGCLNCHRQPKCVQNDDMRIVLSCLKNAELLIIGTPNYFDSVSSLAKLFIDRTHPFYKQKLLKGKRLMSIVVGGGKIEHSKRIKDYDIKFFADTHEMEYIGGYCFKGLNTTDVQSDEKQKSEIKNIILKVSEYRNQSNRKEK